MEGTQEADEYGSYGYAASPSLGEAARSIPKPLMPPLPTETHSTGAIAASSILCFPTRQELITRCLEDVTSASHLAFACSSNFAWIAP